MRARAARRETFDPSSSAAASRLGRAARSAWLELRRRRRERIYIMPTGFGFLFLFGVAIMIMVGAAYANNLVNLLAYFLGSLVVVAMVQTHVNLRDIKVARVVVDPGPAGGEARATVVLENRSGSPKFSIDARLRGPRLLRDDSPDVPALPRSTLRLQQAYAAGERGRKSVSRVEISTSYPLGLFRAWSLRDVEASYWIWPKPDGELPRPARAAASEDSDGSARPAERAEAQDFRGHRAMAAGDSYRRVDWRAYARTGEKLVKEFDGGQSSVALLDWADSAAAGAVEARLSQMAKWVEALGRERVPFAMKTPDRTFGPAAGSEHVLRCLEELAQWPKEDA